MAQRHVIQSLVRGSTRATELSATQSVVVGNRQIRQQYRLLSSAHRPSDRSCIRLPPAYTQVRYSSHSPMGTIVSQRKKVTIETLRKMWSKKDPITMITAHDFPSAHVADHAGMDMILVGDSLAMVALGMEDTSEVLLEEMILHCRSVSRATKSAFTVGDLPMGSYEISPEQALESAIRIIKEGRVQSVKLEGGIEMAPTIRKITRAGIPVVAHIGLTPQRQNALGGFRVQGKSTAAAMRLFEDALAVQEAGAFAVVLEAVPAQVAGRITDRLRIPTIGIGAGKECSGQVLVQTDMAGNFPPGRFIPKFVKKYGDVWGESMKAIQAYKDDVKTRVYPAPEHTYPMPEAESESFDAELGQIEAGLEQSLYGKVISAGEWNSQTQTERDQNLLRIGELHGKRFRDIS